MDERPTIEASGLKRVYGRGGGMVPAVKGIDLSVKPGEVFGFLGPNGAGKTTTVRMLTGLLRPTGGSARVAGCDVVSERRELHRRIGLVFDTHNMYEPLSGRQNLEFFASLYRVSRRRVDEMIRLVEMEEAAGRRFKTYSKGMKQRMVLARALLPDPQVLFLDEPTAGLDPASALRVREVIGRVAAEGKTVFLTTHAMTLADLVCGRLAIVDRGKIAAQGTPVELKRAHGASRVKVTLVDGTVEELEMGSDEASERLGALMRSDQVAEVATVQPTLEDVFLALTGRRLK